MKNKIFMIMAGASLMLSTSCEDFLEEDNKTGYTADIVYSTRSGIEGLVSSCYVYTRAWYGKEAAFGLSEGGADTYFAAYDNRQYSLIKYEDITPVAAALPEKNNSCLDEYWELFNTAVDVCNNALVWVPKNTTLTDSEKDQFLGEAHFLRAFYYWHLVNIWGPVQINREPVSTPSSNAIRNSEEEVYSFMLEDLDLAVELLQGQKVRSSRANYWGAKAFKSRVLLYAASWLGKNSITTNQDYAGKDLYALAAQEADDVISGSGASFYENTADTWLMSNNTNIKDNKEAIWGVSYSDNMAQNILPKRLKTNASGEQINLTNMIRRNGTSGGNAAHLMFVGGWDKAPDTKNIFVRTTNDASNQITVDGVAYPLNGYYSKYSRGFTRYTPTLYQLNLYNDETDQRYQASFRDVYTKAPGLPANSVYPLCQDTVIYLMKKNPSEAQVNWSKDRYRLMPLSDATFNLPVLYTSDDAQTALPTSTKPTITAYSNDWYAGNRIFISNKKFETDDPSRSENDWITPELTDRDFMVIRLAELYLIKAEGLLGSGNVAGAKDALNVLRSARAIAGKDNSFQGTVTLDEILDERARELTGEQQRWFDLKRTHTLKQRLTNYNPQAAANFKDYYIYRPIPQEQMDAVTNPGSFGEEGKFYQNENY